MRKKDSKSIISSVDYTEYLKGQVQSALIDRFRRYSQYGWRENQITSDLCWNLSEQSGHHVNLEGKNASVRWLAQRNVSRLERETGDIGLIIRYKYASGEIVIGFAHLEAKRIFFKEDKKTGAPLVGTGTFKSLHREQIVRHLKNTHAHYILLYDMASDNVGLATNLVSPRFLALNTRNGSLHHAGESLADILVQQFIKGYGLEYGGSIGEHIDRWSGTRGVDFILIANIAERDDMGRPIESRRGGGEGPGSGGIALMKTMQSHGFQPLSLIIEEAPSRTLPELNIKEHTEGTAFPIVENKRFFER